MRSACVLLFSACVSVSSALCQTPVAAPPGTAPHAAEPTRPAVIKPAYEADPKFQRTMSEAKVMELNRRYEFAREDYVKANKLAGGACGRCLDALFEVQLGLGIYKDAVVTANQLKALANTPVERSRAEALLGRALWKQAGEKPKPAQLEGAHAAFQDALTDYPKNLTALYSDACVLTRLGKMDEASKEFSQCAEGAQPKDPLRLRARHFAENPALSMSRMAPAFEVTALDGQRFNLDDMGGRVVLIDFWATWCGPCNAELPQLKKISREFANDPLVIISISWDADEAKWKSFVAKNEMTWLQYRDVDHSLTNRFGIDSIPHYFTIDSDGVLTAELLGSDSNVEGKLKKLIKRAREAKPPAQVTAQLTTGAQ